MYPYKWLLHSHQHHGPQLLNSGLFSLQNLGPTLLIFYRWLRRWMPPYVHRCRLLLDVSIIDTTYNRMNRTLTNLLTTRILVVGNCLAAPRLPPLHLWYLTCSNSRQLELLRTSKYLLYLKCLHDFTSVEDRMIYSHQPRSPLCILSHQDHNRCANEPKPSRTR